MLKRFLAICLCWLTLAVSAEQVQPAKRIVALAPHIVESLYDIGAGDRIVGTVDYADYPADALNIPRIGGYYGIQLEKVLALEPDLIIVWKTGNKAADIEKLVSLGLPLAYSDPQDLNGVAAELRLFGRLTGLEQNAEQVAKQYEADLTAIQQTYQNKTPMAVFYQLWSEPLMTVNKNTWIHQLIETCGGVNVFADNATDYPQIGMENVLVAKPEVIIMPNEKADKPQPKIDWGKWPVIPAVQHNRFMTANADLVHRFSRRMLIGLNDMCAALDGFRE